MPDRALDELLDQAIDAILAGAVAETSAPELDSLVRVASALREMPAEDFQVRLKTELQRRANMTAATAAPAVIRTVTPFISVIEGAKLIDFMKHTFAAEETSRHPHGTDGFVAGVRIGDSDLLIMGGESLRGQEGTAALHVYVKDCDAAYQRALEAGATSLGEPADRSYGERAGFVKDFAGNRWYIATRFPSAVTPPGGASVVPFLHPLKARVFIDFLKRAFGAEEIAVYEHAGHVMHAVVRIGATVLEMGEPNEAQPPSTLYVHTDDVDAVYHRATAAGAISILPPADQAYGDRMAILQDPFGNRWLPATPTKDVKR